MTIPEITPGWKYFPLGAGRKTPLEGFSDWPNRATDDPAQIEAWVDAGYNLAIACGPSKIAVIDLDGAEAEANWFALQLEHEFTDTQENLSRKGRHIIFSDPECMVPNSVGKIAAKTDTRGQNGYIVAPGSVVDGVTYRVDVDKPLAPFPPWALALLARKREAVAASDVTLDTPSAVIRATKLLEGYASNGHVPGREEDGDDYPVCCELLNLGLSEEKALELALKHWAPESHTQDLVDFLQTTLRNAASYAQNDAGAWAVPPVQERIRPEALSKLAAESIADAPAERTRTRFSPIFASEFASLPEPKYVIEQLVPDRSITLVYGPSGSFKSFIAQDLLASTAAGIPALDKFATVQGDAVMSAGEAPFGIARKRGPAWALARGIEDLSKFRFAIVPAVPLVSNSEEVKAFVAALKTANVAPRIVAFDTVARAMGGLDENEARAAGLMIAAAEYVVAELGCAVLLVAHTGKDEDKGVRGSSALFAGVDAVFKVSRAKETLAVTLACEKMKDADPPPDIHLQGRAVVGSLVFSAISADEHAALTRTNPPLAQSDIQKALRDAGAIEGVELSTRQLAASMLSGTDKDGKALQAMEKRLRRGAEKQLAAYVVSGVGRGGALKWTFPTIENRGDNHV